MDFSKLTSSSVQAFPPPAADPLRPYNNGQVSNNSSHLGHLAPMFASPIHHHHHRHHHRRRHHKQPHATTNVKLNKEVGN